MPVTFDVPAAVILAATSAIEFNRSVPMDGVGGAAVAEALASGAVEATTVMQVRRFFAVNAKAYVDEVTQMQRTPADSPLARTWLAYGGEAAESWATALEPGLITAGLVEEDPVLALFELDTEEVYQRFSLNAWRYEYGLNPTKAARFMEDYTRATGAWLDYTRAFGAAAEAVGNAVYRRFSQPSPFEAVINAMMVEDEEYAAAAAEDSAEMSASLTESLDWLAMKSKPPVQLAKMVWAPFVAYLILATEQKALVTSINDLSAKVPKLTDKPHRPSAYNDVVNTFIMYFHPTGGHYKDPAGDKDFEGIDAEVYEMIQKAHLGLTLHEAQVRKLLGKARRWTAQNKLAGSMFHVYNADWGKGNWQHILDDIPLDADVREAFATFTASGVKPVAGVKLQQTLSDTAAKAAVLGYLKTVFPDKLDMYFTQVKVGETSAGTSALKLGTPLGIYSLLGGTVGTHKQIVMAAYEVNGGTYPVFVLKDLGTGALSHLSSPVLRDKFVSGATTVLQAHYEMTGTKYVPSALPSSVVPEVPAVAVPVATQPVAPLSIPAPVPEAPQPVHASVPDYLAWVYGDEYNETNFDAVAVSTTSFSAAVHAKYPGWKWLVTTRFSDAADEQFKVYQAFKVNYTMADGDQVDDTIVVMKSFADHLFTDYSSDDLAALVTKGSFKPVVVPAPEAAAPQSPASVAPPKFSAGTTIQYGDPDTLYRILGTVKGPDGALVYVGVRWRLSKRVPKAEVVGSVAVVDTVAKVYASTHTLAISIIDSLDEANWNVNVSLTHKWGNKGSQIYLGDTHGMLLGTATTLDNQYSYPVILTDDVQDVLGKAFNVRGLQIIDLPATVPVVTPSYAPAPGKENPEDPPSEMAGTQAAFIKCAKLGWQPCLATGHKLFTWPLGAVLAYGSNKTRTIVGYAFQPGEVPIYLVKTETGVINFKTAAEAYKYGPVLSYDQVVLATLLPLPGTTTAMPALNYTLSDWAKAEAKTQNLTYCISPKSFPFYVNSTLENGSDTFVLEAFVLKKDGTVKALLRVVAASPLKPGESIIFTTAVTATFSQVYHYGTFMDPANVTFGKSDSDFTPTITIGSVTIPSELPSGWDQPESIQQPPTPALEPLQKLSAGVVAVVPQGVSVMAKGTSYALAQPCLVMVHPYAEFAGYKLTFPKGRVDAGESIEKAAVREAFEETGLAVKLKKHLGDFKGKTTMTRFFAATVIGGNPKKAGKETDAVTLKPLFGWADWNGADAEAYVASLPWSKLLLQRDLDLLHAVLPAFKADGLPEHIQVDAAEYDHQVASDPDLTQTVPYDASLSVAAPNTGLAGQLPSTIDYVPPPNAVAGVAGSVGFGNKSGWKWISVQPLLDKGYPPTGVWVKLQLSLGVSSPIFVCGYLQDAAGKLYCVTLQAPSSIAVSFVSITGTASDAERFIPVVATEAPKVALQVGPQVTDFWDSFFKKFPFPITTQMVQVLKNVCEREEFTPVSAFANKSKISGPVYGTGFTFEGGTFLAMGHVTLTSGTNTDLPLQLGLDATGTYAALPGSSLALGKMAPDQATTDTYLSADPWFTHPDPVVNKVLAILYANGGNVEAVGVTMKIVKEKWFKEAGVPNYAVVSQNILQDVCALFIPGASTKPQHDATLACLKHRMKLTQKGKGKPDDTVSSAQAINPNKVQVQTTSWKSPAVSQVLADTSAYVWSGLAPGFTGGSKPNFIVTGAGMKWVFKPTPTGDKSPFRPYTDKAASDFLALIKPQNTVPVSILKIDGQIGSVQPVVESSASLNPHDYDGLTDTDKAEILASHAADMFIGDHDGHFGNWLRTPGGLVSIDKGQAFKFLLKGVPESLHPSWEAPGNFGIHLAKKLLLDWSPGAVEIPASAWSSMLSVIMAVAKIDNKTIDMIVSDLSQGAVYTLAQFDAITKGLRDRKATYLADWTKVLTALAKGRGEVFKWPSASPAALNVPIALKQLPKTLPKSLGEAAAGLNFTAAESVTIADANKAGWQGKSISVDGPHIENQEVMVKRVKYSSADSAETHATLIHFRMSYLGATLADSALSKKAKVIAASAVGPTALSVDTFWLPLKDGVITINSHMGPLGKNKDGKPNPATIAKVQDIVPLLTSLKVATTDPKGAYLGVSNTAVFAMAQIYLQYADIILKTAAKAPLLLDQPVETFYQFTWQEPAVKTEEFAMADVQVVKTLKAGFWPTSSTGQKEVVVKGTDSPMFTPFGSSGSYAQSQYCVTVPSVPGARLYFNPAKAEHGGSAANTHFGQAWGLIPGEPTEANVALLLAAFKTVSGVDMAISALADRELLWLSKQAYLLQGLSDGNLVPTANGEGIKDPMYAAAMSDYEYGKKDTAIKKLREFVATKTGTTSAALVTMPGYNAPPEYTRGAGFQRTLRFGLTVPKLKSALGSDVYIAHHLTTAGALPFLQNVVPHNGALLANGVRTFYGLPVSGGSPDSDFVKGGSANVFFGMRKAGSVAAMVANHLYFDISLCLRSDVYVIGSGDAYGESTASRYLSVASWVKHGANNKTGAVSTGESFQFNAKHDVDLRQYLAYCVFGSKTERDAAVKLCKEHGWTTFANGRSVEDVMVTK